METVAKSAKRTIRFSDLPHFRELCGVNDERLRLIEKLMGVEIGLRDDSVFINGEDENTSRASNLLLQFNELIAAGVSLETDDVRFISKYLSENPSAELKEMFGEGAVVKTANKQVVSRSIAQRGYIYSLQHSDVVIGIGPAGTGKTYLAMAVAVSELLKKKTSRIILTRPAVEAGESLGFLPGDLLAKISPYLRPLYDALYEMLGHDKLHAMMEQGQIEVAPLAYMRGRTLNDSFIVLDEAQNCTSEQMKMFLTRLGTNSKAAITGDITQIDLPKGRISGLVEVKNILSSVQGIDIIYFSKRDVVRHELVEKIIGAYEGHEAEKDKNGSLPKP